MADADYIVMNADGDYWTGDGWDRNSDNALGLTARTAAEVSVANAPSDILFHGVTITVDPGAGHRTHCFWVDYR